MISTSIKKHILFGCIVFLGLWPIFHHWLVTRYEMDPWKYFGMSMYSTPRTIASVPSTMEIAYPGQTFQEVTFRSREHPFASQLHQKARELVRRRSDYGTLYRPEVIVKEMFQILPSGIDRLAFTIGFLSFGSEAMLTLRVVRTECQRRMGPSGVECNVVP